jgi:hypothetical protein
MNDSNSSDESLVGLEFKRAYDAIQWTWIGIVFVGLFLNVFTFLVFSRKKFRKTVFNTYFRALLLTDSLSLIPVFFPFIYYQFNFNLSAISAEFCSFFAYLTYVVTTFSPHTLVVISIDRFLSICFSTRFSFRKKFKFQLAILSSVLLFNMAIYSETALVSFTSISVFDNSTNTSSTYNDCSAVVDQAILMWLNMFNSCLIPFTLMLIFSSLTVHLLFKSRSRSQSSQNQMRTRDRKFAIVSISTNFAFLILSLPAFLINFTLFVIDTSIFDQTTLLDLQLVYNVFYLMNLVNSSSQFFINVFFNTMFRDEIHAMFGSTRRWFFILFFIYEN